MDLTSGVETVGVQRSLGPLRQLKRSEDIRRLGLEVRARARVALGARVFELVEINALAERVAGTRDEDDAGRVACRSRRQKFGGEELRKKERADVGSGNLTL
jgi:hypothetical protein